MAIFVPGQLVKIKTLAEICEEFGFDKNDIERGVRIGCIRLTEHHIEYMGRTFTVNDVDRVDNSLYIDDIDSWLCFEILRPASDPDCLFGFKAGDLIEFRQYEDMKADGTIEFNWFTDGMLGLCGKRGKITKVLPHDGRMAEVRCVYESGKNVEWMIDTTMIEHVDDSPAISLDDWLAVAFQ